MKPVTSLLATLLMLVSLGAYAGEREAVALQQVADGALLFDVRTPGEYAQGHLAGSENIPYPQIVTALNARKVAKDQPIVVYCRSGNRSGIAERMLRDAGYTTIHNGGGLRDLQRQAALQ